jgi:hypothetical protein
MEVLVQFPVETGNAQEIDQRITQELLRAINMEPKLRVAGAEVPTVRLKSEAAKAVERTHCFDGCTHATLTKRLSPFVELRDSTSNR